MISDSDLYRCDWTKSRDPGSSNPGIFSYIAGPGANPDGALTEVVLLDLFLDSRSFTGASTEVVELGAPDIAAALHRN